MPETSTIIGILAVFFGTGFFGLVLKGFFDWKKNKADTAKVISETESQNLSNENAEYAQLKNKTETLRLLLHDAEESTQKALKLKETLDTAQGDNLNLKLEIGNQKAIINYQKDERKEWMEMLKSTLEANAQRDAKILQMENLQKQHTKEINECTDRDVKNKEIIGNLENRLNITIGILQKNKLEIPEGLHWTSTSEQ